MEIWFAADCSGSVSGSAAYFAELEAALHASPPATSYLLWDNSVAKSDREATQAWIRSKQGRGGTEPSKLAARIKELRFHGVLRFFTDGSVCERWSSATTSCTAEP